MNSSIIELIILAPPLLLALTLHEVAHGFMAYRLGEEAPRANVLQMRNDYARHEAFTSLFTMSFSRKEDFSVPDIALVGTQP